MHVRECALVVITGFDGRVLMQHRDPYPWIPHPGQWTFPGGQVNPDEAAHVAARREVLEETGLAVQVLNLLGDPVTTGNDGAKVRHWVFRADTTFTQGDVVCGEGQAMVFRTLEEIRDLDLAPIARQIVGDYLCRQQNKGNPGHELC